MRAHLGRDIVDGESGGCRVGKHASDERTQLTTMMVGGMGLLRGGDDERPDAAASLDDAAALELRVDARDGVGVDAEVDRELADRGELIADLESAGGED